MAIPIKDIVNVTIGVSPTPLGSAGFGNLLFLTDEIGSGAQAVDATTRVSKFQSASAVADAFPAGTYPEVNAAATAYYAQVPQPLNFYVGGVLSVPTAAYYTSGAHSDLSALQAITSGGFTITVDGATLSITGVDLSSATSLGQVATALQTVIVAEHSGDEPTVGYDAVQGRFVITSGDTGSASAVSASSSDIGGLGSAMGLDSGVATAVVLAETPAISAGQCKLFNEEFNEIVLDKKYRDAQESVDVAEWAQANKVIFGNTTNDSACLSASGASGTIAGAISDKALSRTVTTYASNVDEYPSCSVLGRINTVNYGAANSTLTLMFKRLPTITAEDLNSTQKAALESINVNAFSKHGSTSLYTDSRMGDGGWLDTVHGLDWLESQVQLNVFNLLYTSTTKIPYTDTGIQMITGAVAGALEQGKLNGLIAPSGTTAEGEFLVNGYKIETVPVAQVASSDKGNRIYNGISFKCVGAGALHNVTVSGTFSE